MTAILQMKQQQSPVAALAMNEEELIAVLQNSVYPGAKTESIKFVINACRASGKDPLKKPYHIVPMPVSTGKKDSGGWDVKEMRDVVMPGINDYRTDAARTGEHVGTSEPEYGPDVTENLDGVQMTYPAWCRVTVKRLKNGVVCDFPAVERWKENYATKSNKSDAPNSMWKKRPYAQLAKCAEAQALRKGFPEVGNQPTADEMEGKELDMGSAEVVIVGETIAPSNTRTEALKSHLGASKKKPAVTLEQVIDGLNAANSAEDLLAAAELAKSLTGDEKAKAGAAYTARLHQLKAAAHGVDTSSGEIIDQPAQGAVDPDDEFLKGLEKGPQA